MMPLITNTAQRLVYERAEAQLKAKGRVRMLILKARQEGISTWVASRIFRGCTLWGHKRGLVLADKVERAQEIFGIYERYWDNLPAPLKPPTRGKQRGRHMNFLSDSKISVETAGDPDAGRGYTVQYLHASELAMWAHADETWTALMQALGQDGSEVYIESTARGVGNLFHRLWVGAVAGENDWDAVFLPWWIHNTYRNRIDDKERQEIEDTNDDWERIALDTGIEWEGSYHKLTPEQLSWRRWKIRNDLGGGAEAERAFRQEFPSTADEAFLVSGQAFFDDDALLEARRYARPPLATGQLQVDARKTITFYPSERGWLQIWEMPRPDCHYVIGADTAAGKVANARHDTSNFRSEAGGRDFSSADVLCCCQLVDGRWERAERQVAQLHGRMAPELFAEGLWSLGNFYASASKFALSRPALIGVERNHASGQTALRELREKWRYQSLYYNRRFNTRMRKATEYLGWVTDSQSRQPMLDSLAAALREGTLDVASTNSIKEMFTFVRNLMGEPMAQEGCHDDRVISLAITLEMSRWHIHDPVGEVPEWQGANTVTRM